MTEKQILLVKHSWSYVTGHLEDVSALYCKKLAKLMPEFRSLIPDPGKNPEGTHLIISTINQLVSAIPDFQKAEKDILILLTAYADKGITRTDYDSALIAFLFTMEKKLGKKWTNETREAWIFAFSALHQHFISLLQIPITLTSADENFRGWEDH